MAIQENIVELAKQGDPQAIATLIYRQLKSKGIKVQAKFKDNCLQIRVESDQIPDQETMVAFIRKGITSLKSKGIEKVRIYGRKTGEEFTAWSHEFELIAQTNSAPFTVGQSPTIPSSIVKKNVVSASLRKVGADCQSSDVTSILNQRVVVNM